MDDPDGTRYDKAKRTLQALVAAYAERIETADESQAGPLLTDQIRYGRELTTLDPTDTARLTTIIDHYPALVEQVRAG
jgi:hypothetical protein